MKIAKNSKVVMIGDSITDMGRTPAGEGLFDPMGKGYVTLVNALIGAVYPERGIRIVNRGCSGHNTRDLVNRWKTDVLDLKPDWVSVMIGINDVWRQYDVPTMTESHVLIDEYEANLVKMIEQTQPVTKGMILMTPYYIESNRKDAMRATMDRYGAVVKKLARKYGTIFVDTQAAFDAALKHWYAATLAWDRVHPNQAGHMILARAFCKAVELEW